MKIAILGAGLTGLELGRKLKELDKDFFILEKESQIGGLCRTNKTGNYYWDFAVHAVYSRNKEIMDYFSSLPLDYESLERNVKIFHTSENGKTHILNYPFEIGVKDLPLNDKLECVQGYVAARAKGIKKSSNLKEWIENSLGPGMAKHFMIPYNSKIWNCPLEEISEKLVSAKIEPASIIDFIMSVLGKNVVGRAYQAKFIYPKQGIQQLIDYTAKDIKDNVHLNADVVKLERSLGRWKIYTNNEVFEADMIASTIPLVNLLKKVDIEGLKKEYGAFRWNDTHFVMVGLKDGYDFNLIKDCHWVFFKGKEIFYRITLMHNFSAEFKAVLVAEITQKDNLSSKSNEEIVSSVVKDLVRLGIVGSENEIDKTDIKLVEHTYPIPTVGCEQVKHGIRTLLERYNLFLLGRNGNWDYINMDGVVANVQKFVSEKFLPVHYLEKIVERAQHKAAELAAEPTGYEEPMSFKERAFFTAKILGSGLLIFLLMRRLNLAEAALALKQANFGFLGLALISGLAFMLIRAYKWFEIVKPYLIKKNFVRTTISYMFGLGVSILTPGRIGEVARIVNSGVTEKAAPAGLFLLDKIIDVLIVFSMSLFGAYFLFPDKFNIPILIFLLFAALAFLFFMKQIYLKCKKNIITLPFGKTIDRALKAIALLSREKIIMNALLTLISYIVCVIEVFFILKAFCDINLMDVFKVHPVVMMSNILPVTVGGLGLREGLSVFLYSKFGIAKEFAFWGGFLIFGFNTLLYGILGTVLINFNKRKIKK